MKEKQTYKVFAFDKDFIEKHDNFEQLVALQPRQVAAVLDWKEADDFDSFDGLVCIQSKEDKSKRIYRKVMGTSLKDLDSDYAVMSSRSMKKLKIKKYDEIVIKKTNWFCYLWNHSDASIRCPFKVAVVFGVLSLILGVLSLIVSCYCCNC